MSTDLQEMFKKMGLDVEDLDVYDTDDDEFTTNSAVENGNNRIKKMKVDFGLNYHVILPVWLEIPFNIYTLEPLGRGKAMRSHKLGKPPSEIIRIMAAAAEQDEEYRNKLWTVLDIPEFLVENRKKATKEEITNFKFEVNKDGSCTPLMGELISRFFNFYMYSGEIQRYALNSERTVSRKALIPLKPSGAPDFDNASERLHMAYACESNLLFTEIQKTVQKLELEQQTKKYIDTQRSTLKRMRIVSAPTSAAFAFGFAFPVNATNDFSDSDAEKFSAASYKLSYAQTYFRILSKDIQDFTIKAKSAKVTNANYIEVIRSYPVDTDNSGNKGLCAQGVYLQAVIAGKDISKKLPNVPMQLQDFLSNPDNTDPAEIKKFITEFEEISEEEVMAAYANNITQYVLALKDPEVIQKNSRFLSQCENQAGLALVNRLVGENKVAIDINQVVSVEDEVEAAVNEAEYFDSDEADTSPVSASSFLE